MRHAMIALLLIVFGFILFAGSVRDTYQVHPGICDGCAECAMVCPNNAITYYNELHSMRIDQSLCDGCGDCVEVCPRNAIYQNDARSFIVGTVTDSSTQFGMRGAIISADTCSTVSDMWGDYCVQLMPETYDVICEADGYEGVVEQDVYVSADTAIVINFMLVPINSIPDEEIEDCPERIEFFPNPVRTGSDVRLSLPEYRSCTINIYNVVGQKVRTLHPTSASVLWDTRDHSGKSLSAGVYFYRVKLDSSSSYGKLLLVD